jgi:predicted transcriptional regulator
MKRGLIIIREINRVLIERAKVKIGITRLIKKRKECVPYVKGGKEMENLNLSLCMP